VGTLSEARSVLKTYFPSIIFLDNHLPDGLGVEFIHYIKLCNPQIKIVIITGHDTNLSRAREEGASEIIFKPFSSDKIFSIIEEYS
jgi:response regulator of citrate/malate metabolism